MLIKTCQNFFNAAGRSLLCLGCNRPARKPQVPPRSVRPVSWAGLSATARPRPREERAEGAAAGGGVFRRADALAPIAAGLGQIFFNSPLLGYISSAEHGHSRRSASPLTTSFAGRLGPVG